MKTATRSAFRRVQVFGISLTEMILILLFFMFLIAKNAIDAEKKGSIFIATCANRLVTCEQKLALSQEQIAKRDVQLLELNKEVTKLKDWVATLMTALGLKPLPADHPGFIDNAGPKIAKVSGGTGKPNCLPGNNFLLELTMADGVFTARRLWGPGDESIVASALPISELVGAGRISFDTFKNYAVKIAASKAECTFSVKVIDRTTTKESFKSQLLFLERHFKRRVE